jgi:hypothetical protein
VAQSRGVHGQGQLAALGRHERDHPAQQGGKTAGHLQRAPLVAACGPPLVVGIAIPVAQLLANCLLAAVEQIGQDHRDLGQAAALGQDNARTPQREHQHLRLAQVRQLG